MEHSFLFDEDNNDEEYYGRGTPGTFTAGAASQLTQQTQQTQHTQQSLYSYSPNEEYDLTASQLTAPTQESRRNLFGTPATLAFVCEQCGNTTTELDEGTGKHVCTECGLEANILTQDMLEVDVDEAMGLAARTGARGSILTQRQPRLSTVGHTPTTTFTGEGEAHTPHVLDATTADTRTRQSHLRKELHEFNTAQPLPTLAVCLDGMQCILYRSTACIVKLMLRDLPHLMVSQQQETTTLRLLLDIVKHVWLSYLRSWHLGAQYYGRKQPSLRLSFRDFFLPPKYKSLVHKVVAHNVITGQQQTRQLSENAVKEDSSVTSEMHVPQPLHTPQTPQTPLTTTTPQGARDTHAHQDILPDRIRSAAKVKLFTQDTSNATERGSAKKQDFTFQQLIHQLTIYHTYTQSKGSREAALLLPVKFDLVVTILYVATIRAGVAPHHLLTWLRHGDWPLWDAYSSKLLSNKRKKSLELVQSFFRLSKLPTVAQLERDAQLLLLASGVENEASWRELDISTRKGSSNEMHSTTMPATMPVSSIPTILAQSVADLGLGPDVLRTALHLMGVQQSAAGSGGGGLMAGVLWPVAEIRNLPDILAILVCATVLVRDPSGRVWKRTRRNKDDESAAAGSDKRVPWTESEFVRLEQGAVQTYLDFYSTFAPTTSLAPDVTDLLSMTVEKASSSQPNHAENQQYTTPTRSCPLLYNGMSYSDEFFGFPLRRLVYRALRSDGKASSFPTLSPAERLVIDFVAFEHYIPSNELVRSLQRILVSSSRAKKTATRQKRKRPFSHRG